MNVPKAASDFRIRNRIRDKLVTLGMAPGLAVVINNHENENCILVFPRLGYRIQTFEDALNLEWFSMDAKTLHMSPMSDPKDFLLSLE